MTLSRYTTRSPRMPMDGLPPEPLAHEDAGARLATFIRRHPRLFVLTGAGVSTDSGIPDYRDSDGEWKRRQPVQHQAFMNEPMVRRRYWGRSLVGWPVVRNARPNPAHIWLSELERRGHIHLMVTQNVDRLHQRAGSRRVVDLHGRADQVVCMGCGYRCDRDEVHYRCRDLNPDYRRYSATAAPDGDADLEVDFSRFRVADCPLCRGILKPDVVFFGDFVPRSRVTSAMEALSLSDGLLVIGSSLMVLSGFRFCRRAKEWGKPVAILNQGRTRADAMASQRLNARIGETLEAALSKL